MRGADLPEPPFTPQHQPRRRSRTCRPAASGANAGAPDPVRTPLIPSTIPTEAVEHCGEQVPMKQPAQPKELAPVHVMLASDEASYISGATIAVTRGKPII